MIVDRASAIVKDAKLLGHRDHGNGRYPLSLLLRVITMSLETIEIVRGLPKLDILEEEESTC